MTMRDITKGLAAVTLLSATVGTGSVSAQTKVGTSMGQFLGIEPSARVAAMGNAGVALAHGIEAVYFNTGVIATLDRPAVQFTHSAWFAGINYNYAAAAIPVARFGTLFASVTSLNSGEIDVRTVASPHGTGERYDVADVAVSLGYGRRLSHRVATGIQINYVSERIWHSTHDLLTVSVGTMYELTDSGFRIGASLSNMGTKSSYSGPDLAIQYDVDPDVFGDNSALPATQFTGEFPAPIVFRVGLSYPYQTSERTQLLLSVDTLHPNDNTESVNAGAEWSLADALALRAGYQAMFQTDSELGLTLGAGLRGGLGQSDFRFDYAWAEHEHLQETHRMTLILEF